MVSGVGVLPVSPSPRLPVSPSLPAGTVTYLLTDIESSTKLWLEHPESMRHALARHDALLREEIECHGGTVLKQRGEGDSCFAVFSRATDAVAAAEREVAVDEGARQLVVTHPARDLATIGDASNVEWLVDPQPHTLNHTVLQMLGTPEEASDRPLIRIYLVCDRQDHPLLLSNRARSLRDHLLSLGFEVKTPLAEDGDELDARKLRPRVKVVPGEEAAADDGASEVLHDRSP